MLKYLFFLILQWAVTLVIADQSSFLTAMAAISSATSSLCPSADPTYYSCSGSSLASIDFSSQSIVGVIPSLSGLTAVSILDMSNNQLFGVIPSLSDLVNLKYLDLSSNSLSGIVPSLEANVLLTQLVLSSNALSYLPSLCSNCGNYAVCELSSNDFISGSELFVDGYDVSNNCNAQTRHTAFLKDMFDQGIISEAFCDSSGLYGGAGPAAGVTCASNEVIAISRQSLSLTGTIPPVSLLGDSLLQLGLAGNSLTGTIPSVASSQNMQSLDVSYNSLSGTLPSLSNSSSLIIFAALGVGLTGTIPPLSHLSVQTVALGSNQLSGTIPPFPSSLRYLSSGPNKLTGTVPSVASVTALGYFNIYNNKLTGTLPDLASQTSLSLLWTGFNKISGNLPSFNFAAMTSLYMGDSVFTGTIPALNSMTAIKYINLRQNNLKGTIPPLSGLTVLESLILNNNRLRGTLPPLSTNSLLDEINIADNYLQAVDTASCDSGPSICDFSDNYFMITPPSACSSCSGTLNNMVINQTGSTATQELFPNLQYQLYFEISGLNPGDTFYTTEGYDAVLVVPHTFNTQLADDCNSSNIQQSIQDQNFVHYDNVTAGATGVVASPMFIQVEVTFSDYGEYTLCYMTSHGDPDIPLTEQQWFPSLNFITVYGVPPKQPNITLHSISSDTAEFSWSVTDLNDCLEDSWTLGLYNQDADSLQSIASTDCTNGYQAAGSALHCELESLLGSTQYTIIITQICVNDVSLSQSMDNREGRLNFTTYATPVFIEPTSIILDGPIYQYDESHSISIVGGSGLMTGSNYDSVKVVSGSFSTANCSSSTLAPGTNILLSELQPPNGYTDLQVMILGGVPNVTIAGTDLNFIETGEYTLCYKLSQAEIGGGNYFPVSSFTVTVNPDAPVAVLVSSSLIDTCTALQVEASESFNLSPTATAFFEWTIDPSPNISASAYSSLSGYGQDFLSLSPSVLLPDNYTISLVITQDSTGYRSNTASRSVSVVTTPTATITTTQPVGVTRGQSTTIAATIELSACQVGSLTGVDWSLGSCSACTSPELLDIEQVLVTGSTSLLIPAFTLATGSIYMLELIGYDSGTILGHGSVSFSVEVTAYVALISGSADREREASSPISIDPTLSYDPDDQSFSTTSSTVSWSCQIEDSSTRSMPPKDAYIADLSNVTDCQTKILSISSTSASGLLTIPSNTLTEDESYLFRLCLSCGTSREGLAYVRIRAIPTSLSPLVTTILQSSSTSIQNYNEKLSIRSFVVVRSLSTEEDLLYSWSSVPNLNLNSSSSGILTTAVGSAHLGIAASSLSHGTTYQFVLSVTDPLLPDSPASSVSSVTINAPPASGSCIVTADSTPYLELITEFTLQCSGWSDMNLPLTYSFYYINYENAVPTERLLRTKIVASSSFSTVLPNGNLSLVAYIEDSQGATTRQQFADSASALTLFVGTQSYNTSDNAAIVNFVSNTIDTVLSDAQNQDDAATTVLLVDSLGTNLQNVEDADDVDQIQDTLLDALASVSNTTQDPLLAGNVITALDSVTAASDELSPDQVAVTSQTLLDAVSALTQSSDAEVSDAVISSSLDVIANVVDAGDICDSFDSLLDAATQLIAANGDLLPSEATSFSSSSSSVQGSSLQLGSAGETGMAGVSVPAEVYSSFSPSSDSIDTTPVTNSSEPTNLITITFPDNILACFGDNASEFASGMSNIFAVNSLGQVVEVSSLTTPIVFRLELGEEATSSCDTVTQECRWYDESTDSWSTSGCTSSDPYLEDGNSYIDCSCLHLTAFAVLNARSQGDACSDPVNIFGSEIYLILSLIYSVLLLISSWQLFKIIVSTGFSRWLMLSEHIILSLLMIFRMANVLLYYSLSREVSDALFVWLTLFPSMISSWMFTLVIFAWGSIFHAAGKSTASPYLKFRLHFLVINIVVIGIQATMFYMYYQSNNAADQEFWTLLGSIAVGTICLAISVFFLVTGTLLVRQLTQDFPSRYARRLFRIAVAFSLSLVFQSILTFYSRLDVNNYIDNFDVINTLYFLCDIAAAITLLIMFWSAVNTAWNQRKGGTVRSVNTRSKHTRSKHRGRGKSRGGSKKSSKSRISSSKDESGGRNTSIASNSTIVSSAHKSALEDDSTEGESSEDENRRSSANTLNAPPPSSVLASPRRRRSPRPKKSSLKQRSDTKDRGANEVGNIIQSDAKKVFRDMGVSLMTDSNIDVSPSNQRLMLLAFLETLHQYEDKGNAPDDVTDLSKQLEELIVLAPSPQLIALRTCFGKQSRDLRRKVMRNFALSKLDQSQAPVIRIDKEDDVKWVTISPATEEALLRLIKQSPLVSNQDHFQGASRALAKLFTLPSSSMRHTLLLSIINGRHRGLAKLPHGEKEKERHAIARTQFLQAVKADEIKNATLAFEAPGLRQPPRDFMWYLMQGQLDLPTRVIVNDALLFSIQFLTNQEIVQDKVVKRPVINTGCLSTKSITLDRSARKLMLQEISRLGREQVADLEHIGSLSPYEQERATLRFINSMDPEARSQLFDKVSMIHQMKITVARTSNEPDSTTEIAKLGNIEQNMPPSDRPAAILEYLNNMNESARSVLIGGTAVLQELFFMTDDHLQLRELQRIMDLPPSDAEGFGSALMDYIIKIDSTRRCTLWKEACILDELNTRVFDETSRSKVCRLRKLPESMRHTSLTKYLNQWEPSELASLFSGTALLRHLIGEESVEGRLTELKRIQKLTQFEHEFTLLKFIADMEQTQRIKMWEDRCIICELKRNVVNGNERAKLTEIAEELSDDPFEQDEALLAYLQSLPGHTLSNIFGGSGLFISLLQYVTREEDVKAVKQIIQDPALSDKKTITICLDILQSLDESKLTALFETTAVHLELPKLCHNAELVEISKEIVALQTMAQPDYTQRHALAQKLLEWILSFKKKYVEDMCAAFSGTGLCRYLTIEAQQRLKQENAQGLSPAKRHLLQVQQNLKHKLGSYSCKPSQNQLNQDILNSFNQLDVKERVIVLKRMQQKAIEEDKQGKTKVNVRSSDIMSMLLQNKINLENIAHFPMIVSVGLAAKYSYMKDAEIQRAADSWYHDEGNQLKNSIIEEERKAVQKTNKTNGQQLQQVSIDIPSSVVDDTYQIDDDQVRIEAILDKSGFAGPKRTVPAQRSRLQLAPLKRNPVPKSSKLRQYLDQA